MYPGHGNKMAAEFYQDPKYLGVCFLKHFVQAHLAWGLLWHPFQTCSSPASTIPQTQRVQGHPDSPFSTSPACASSTCAGVACHLPPVTYSLAPGHLMLAKDELLGAFIPLRILQALSCVLKETPVWRVFSSLTS